MAAGINKKVIGLMEDELGPKIMAIFVVLRPKTHAFLTDYTDYNRL